MVFSTSANSQIYPARAVRIISPFAAGGSNDVAARLVGNRLAEQLGHSVIVDNRPGAGGVVGTELGARAAPDGYTLIMATNATLAIAPALRKTQYDPEKDFAPVGLTGSSAYIVVAHPSVPAKNIPELIALVKSRPGQVEFGSSGVGTLGHLAGTMLNTMSGIKMVHVPYKAGNLALNDLLGGHIALTFSSAITASEMIKAGKVRALAVTSRQRIAAFPHLPTVAESGVANYEFMLWLGLIAPALTPPDIIRHLNKSLVTALQDTALQSRMRAQSVDPLISSPQEFAERIRRDRAIFSRLVNEAGAMNEQ